MKYLEQKKALLADYASNFGINAVCFGMSGGVDSAVVGAMLAHFMKDPSFPIRKVVAIVAPIRTEGATNQDVARERALRVCQALGLESWVVDLTNTQRQYEQAMRLTPSTAMGDKRVWADGQILSITRTPIFYGVAAHLQAMGFRSVVAGTTNRSEGSYIGFYGKASDGMCDIQIISDLWKSQVYEVARFLGVPQEVIEETPRGDVWDGRVDEEMIGAPYPFLERYLEGRVDNPSAEEEGWAAAIERIHSSNAHKYLVGSPAVHFDVFPRYVEGGWGPHNTFTWTIGR